MQGQHPELGAQHQGSTGSCSSSTGSTGSRVSLLWGAGPRPRALLHCPGQRGRTPARPPRPHRRAPHPCAPPPAPSIPTPPSLPHSSRFPGNPYLGAVDLSSASLLSLSFLFHLSPNLPLYSKPLSFACLLSLALFISSNVFFISGLQLFESHSKKKKKSTPLTAVAPASSGSSGSPAALLRTPAPSRGSWPGPQTHTPPAGNNHGAAMLAGKALPQNPSNKGKAEFQSCATRCSGLGN